MHSKQELNIKTELLDTLGEKLKGTVFFEMVRYPDGKKEFSYLSKNVELITGKSIDEVKKNPDLLYQTVHLPYHQQLQEAEALSLHNLSKFEIEVESTWADGHNHWIHLISTPRQLSDGRVIWDGIQTDITEIKRNEIKLQKVNHELKLLNKINDIILTASDEMKLLNDVCSSLIDMGSYKLAWICKRPPLDNPNQEVVPLVAHGEVNYLKNIRIDLNDGLLSQGPTATVLKGGTTYITNNAEKSSAFKPWLEAARKHGISASIVLPIYFQPDLIGTLNVYAADVDAFDEHEVNILERLAENLSFTLSGLRTQKEKEHTQYLLNERIKELSTVYLVNKILQNDSLSSDQILQMIVNLLPSGFLYVDQCQARIAMWGKEFTTSTFKPSPFGIRHDIRIENENSGYIEIVYPESFNPTGTDLFLNEELELIATLAEILGVYFNKQLAMKSLANSEANLKTVFENTEVGYVLIDRAYRVISYNQVFLSGYASYTGFEIKQHIDFTDMVLPERRESIRVLLERIAFDGIAHEYDTNFTRDGETYYFNVFIVPVKNNQEVIGFCLSAYDITRRKFMEMERQKMISDLLQRNRDLEQFAYIVSHNLRAPLANILGLCDVLKENISNPEKQLALEGMEQATQRLDEVVKDMNTILQVNRAVSEVRVPVKLSEMVSNLRSSLADIINEKHAVIDTDFSAANELTVIRTYLGSIIFNILTNSIKFAQPGIAPHIRLWTERLGPNIVLHIKDNGLGINMDKHGTHLFGLYKRFHPHIEGKGMGMYMIKSQVEVLGGTIHVKSKPDEGTEISITFTE